ncbi:protein phosphatase 2C domain-containing protein, partial [Bacteroides sp. OttesenSCG-928-D19]|nr:protein phosphatase 2C domain-containing protein [Bacteroides sp. OttesenSCG-928-D19]
MNKIVYIGESDIGKLRTNNEDTNIAQTIWDKNHVLGVAIDGVGGYDGGERASAIAKETIVSYLEQHSKGEKLDLLKKAVVEANNKIENERLTEKQFSNMACVLTACLVEVEEKRINMVHVGDTRLYQYYNGALIKLSHDHSLIGYREEIGNLTEEEAMNHPERNLINRLVGDTFHHIDDKDFIEAVTFPLFPNSTLLLCSDGLSDMLTSEEILSVLKQTVSLRNKVKTLIQLANDKGGKDNITVVLIDYTDDNYGNNDKLTDKLEKNEEVQLQTPTDKKGRGYFGIIFFALIGVILGLMGGWFGREILIIPPEPLQNLIDSTIIKKDTIRIELNDTCVIRVIGEKLQKDT